MNPLYYKEYDDILPRALALAYAEREMLIEALQRSLIEDPDDEQGTWVLSEAWRAEIARRCAELERGEAKTITFEEFHEHFRQFRERLDKGEIPSK